MSFFLILYEATFGLGTEEKSEKTFERPNSREATGDLGGRSTLSFTRAGI
jgi:hypothetical protein